MNLNCRYGDLVVHDNNDLIVNSLRLYGEWAQLEIDVLAMFINEGSTIVDAGAFIGTHTRAFSTIVGQRGWVHAFEPNPLIFQFLKNNSNNAPIRNVTASPFGLGAKEETRAITNVTDSLNQGSAHLDLKKSNETQQSVVVKPLDVLDLGKVDFIKVDIEGMELELLRGAKDTIKKYRPLIFLEVNSLDQAVGIFEWMRDGNYRTYGLISPAFNPNNFNQVQENIFNLAKECGVLLVPEEKIGEHLETIEHQGLPEIINADDLALLLLHKPQYAYEILQQTAVNLKLGINYPAPSLEILSKTLSDRETQIANFNRIESEQERKLASLNQAIFERDDQLDKLNRNLDEQYGQLANLTQEVIAHDDYIQWLITSKSWHITKPFRWASRVLRGDFLAASAPFKRLFSQYQARGMAPVKSDDENRAHISSGTAANVTDSPIKPTHPVSVILPIYRDVEMTKRCILAAIPEVLAISSSKLIAINDASPDADMQAMLEGLAAQWPGKFFLLKNESNLGFVQTVNRGLAYFSQHDVVLLNSDVIVPNDWLSRLVDEAYSRKNIGIVTPFSNNATICSFPQFLQENLQPFNLDVNSIDAVFRNTKLPCVVSPTGVGFCMYIRRACLEDVGYLEHEKFGRGYGEENNLCQRALKNGWENIISPNIYAYHEGGVSFSSDKQALVDRAMQVLDELHPNYHADVQTFIKNDPLKEARVARYIMLLSSTAVPKVLHISHALGGGIGQHLEELAQHYEQTMAHILLAPSDEGDTVVISLGIGQHVDKLAFSIPSEYETVVELFKAMGISAIHFHHTLGLNSKILALPYDLGVAHLCTVHDFYWLNGNPTLTDESGKYPGYYSDKQHNPLYPLPDGLTPEKFREPLQKLFENAASVIFPSNSTKSLFTGVFPLNNAVVAPHIETGRDIRKIPSAFTKKDSYNIGVLGAIGREKGADLLEALGVAARNAGAPFKFKLIGYAYRPLKVIETTGPYSFKQLHDLIEQHELDVILFPAQWPETYSYTLSYALDSGLPIFAPNIGAFPERLSERANSMLFTHLDSKQDLWNQFSEFIDMLAVGTRITPPYFEGDESVYDFYDGVYLETVSRNLKVADPSRIENFSPDSSLLGNHSIVEGVTGWREVILSVLWRLYMHPSMRWVGRIIPFNSRRSIKRFLSSRPMHDIVNSSKGE